MMGTSSSHPGTPAGAPLVPPWADAQPDAPLPPAPAHRFRDFRRSLGKFVRTGDADAAGRALGHFARTGTGGSAHAPRRYGAMSRAGAAFISALGDPAFLQARLLEKGIDLDALRGASRETIIAAISQAFATTDGDRERVQQAIAVALSEAYEGLDIAAFPDLPDDRVDLALIAYVRECIFIQILAESGDAFDAGDNAANAAAERDMHRLIREVVEVEMQNVLQNRARHMPRAEIEAVQIAAIREVWRRWEAQ